ncbi:MAG: dTDP-4-dehydrorhamnose reductase [Chloroflexi bacterium]|nr:MAG: dTDP-4-dehydrorhamnose reductase [Phototrophicales bacterium]RMF78850.1 MAG: dTDP-4-dehydrorhamnose reductase [Chloroflexota bacterium]
MRILVTGAQGQLGRELVTQLRQKQHDVTGADVSDFDITDFTATCDYVRDLQPAFIIHTAAWTDVDGCVRDPEKAIAINGFGAQHVALAAKQVDAPILYISSNEVFDGRKQDPYYEYDVTNPINPYGYSKWVGERAIVNIQPAHYIVRTSWLFSHGGRNFVQTILKAAKENIALQVVTDEVANPTYNTHLAEAITCLIETDRYGIYHFVNEGVCSRYDFARYLLNRAGYADTPIEPITRANWLRASTPPARTGLKNMAGQQVGITLCHWQKAVDEFLVREGLPV